MKCNTISAKYKSPKIHLPVPDRPPKFNDDVFDRIALYLTFASSIHSLSDQWYQLSKQMTSMKNRFELIPKAKTKYFFQN
jgi:hypothetical protein